ncbi:histidine decarboxylase, pyruvoyl type [Endothiovibrio diazotrophicus]
MKTPPAEIDRRAISPYRRHCDGYGAPGAEGNGYVCLLKAATATVEKGSDALLDGIVAYDRAEASGAHLGQINMVTAYRPKRRRHPADGTRRSSLKPGQAYGVWCFIALSIARDRERTVDLFMEDAGLWRENDDPRALEAFLDRHRRAVVRSIVACGGNQRTRFERCYLTYAYTLIEPGQVGTALAVAPYFTLARDAVPPGGFGALYDMTLSQWERAMGFGE